MSPSESRIYYLIHTPDYGFEPTLYSDPSAALRQTDVLRSLAAYRECRIAIREATEGILYDASDVL